MHQPKAIWSLRKIVFDKDISIIQNTVLTQGSSALRAAIDRIDKLWEYTKVAHENVVIHHPDVAPTLSDLCYQAGLASTILFNNAPRGKGESNFIYRLRAERISYVSRYCRENNVKVVILKDKRLRNALTHVDEHLAKEMTKEPNVGWYIDMAIGTPDSMNIPGAISKVKFCRTDIKKRDEIVHLSHKVNVAALRLECEAVLGGVFGFTSS